MDSGPKAATEHYCSFRLNEFWFGVPVQMVREVHALTPVTPIPGAPPAVLGYVNLRGQLYLVLSGWKLMLGEDAKETNPENLFVFDSRAGEFFAVQTGPVGSITAISSQDMDVPSALSGSSQTDPPRKERTVCVVAHAKLDQILVTIIDPSRLLAAAFDVAGVPLGIQTSKSRTD